MTNIQNEFQVYMRILYRDMIFEKNLKPLAPWIYLWSKRQTFDLGNCAFINFYWTPVTIGRAYYRRAFPALNDISSVQPHFRNPKMSSHHMRT